MTTIVSTYQPYFAPFPGFFYKMDLADIFVVLDTVQFPRGATWITRNRFKNDRGTFRLSVPVWRKGLGLQKIDEVRICHEGSWRHKHLAGLKVAYHAAPYAAEHLSFLEDHYQVGFERLVDFNLAIIRYLMAQLGLSADLRLLSELKVDNRGSALLLDICKRVGGDVFLAQQSAGQYLDAEIFAQHGIQLKFTKPPIPIYPQLWGEFIPNLSTFDLLFNCGPKARDILYDHRSTSRSR
jgi:hypothetical protein